MSDPIKILFDENFGKPLVHALAQFFRLCKDPVLFQHVFSFSKEGEKDEIWIPRIASDNWMIISADRGKRCGGQKLPAICHANKITHVLLSNSIHNSPTFEKLRVIISVWPYLVEAASRERGLRFSLRYHGHDRKRAVLLECQSGTFVAIQPRVPNEVWATKETNKGRHEAQGR